MDDDPPEKEVDDFYFKQLEKVRIGDPGPAVNHRCSLLCVSSFYGLTFVGCKEGVHIFQTALLGIKTNANSVAELSSVDHVTVPCASPPLHVSLSSDGLTLCVVCVRDKRLTCLFFDTRVVFSKELGTKEPFSSLPLAGNDATDLLSLQWNPGEAKELIALSLSSGTLVVLEVGRDGAREVCSRHSVNANVVCWSPKGKLLSVGLRDGGVTQYSQRGLEVKRLLPCPNIFDGVAHQVSDLLWISSYQFAAIYTPQSNPTPGLPPPSVFAFLAAPKGAPTPNVVNFDDVFYNTADNPNHFFFIHIREWNIIVAASANGMETVVFGLSPEKVPRWEKWNLMETGRAEFPMENLSDESYAAGLALDHSSIIPVPLTDKAADSHPPSPILLLYSTYGVLCPFSVVSKSRPPEAIALLVSPPKPLPAPESRRAITTANNPKALPRSLPVPSAPHAPPPAPHAPPLTPMAAAATQHSIVSSALNLPPKLSTMGSGLGQPLQLGLGQLQMRHPLQLSTGGQPLQLSHPTSSGGLGGQPLQLSHPTSSGGLGGQPLQLSHPTSSGGLGGQPLQLSHPTNSGGLGEKPLQLSGLTFSGQPLYLSHPKGPSGQPLQLSNPNLLGGQPLPLQLSGGMGSPQRPTQAPSSVGKPVGESTGIVAPHSVGLETPKLSATTSPSGEQLLRPKLLMSTGPYAGLQQQSSAAKQQQPLPTSLSISQAGLTAQTGSGNQLNQSAGLRPPLYSSTPLLQAAMATQQLHHHHQPLLKPQAAMPPPAAASNPLASLSLGSVPQSHSHFVPQAAVPPPAAASSPLTSLSLGSGPQSHSHSVPPVPGPVLHGLRTQQQQQQQQQVSPGNRVTATSREPGAPTPEKDLERSFSKHIKNEIERFTKKLEDSTPSLEGEFGEWVCLGGRRGVAQGRESGELERELGEMFSETKLQAENVNELKEETESLDQSVTNLSGETLRGFGLSAQAQVELKRENDSLHSSSLKMRPLDAGSAKKLNAIRSEYMYLRQVNREVNAQLDDKLKAREDAQRKPMREPPVQYIYTALLSNKKTIKLQKDQALAAIKTMKNLRLLPVSWKPSSSMATTPPRSHLVPGPENTSTSLVSPSPSPSSLPPLPRSPSFPLPTRTPPHGREELSESRSMFSAQKKNQLRDILASRKLTPIRRVRPIPPLQELTRLLSEHTLSETLSTTASNHTDGNRFEEVDLPQFEAPLPGPPSLSGYSLSQGSSKPDVIASQDLYVRNKRHGYTKVTHPVPSDICSQLGRRYEPTLHVPLPTNPPPVPTVGTQIGPVSTTSVSRLSSSLPTVGGLTTVEPPAATTGGPSVTEHPANSTGGSPTITAGGLNSGGPPTASIEVPIERPLTTTAGGLNSGGPPASTMGGPSLHETAVGTPSTNTSSMFEPPTTSTGELRLPSTSVHALLPLAATSRPLSTTASGPPQTTMYEPPQTTTSGPPQTTTYGPPQTTTYGPPQTTTYGPPQTTTSGPPQTTTSGPPQTTTSGPPTSTTLNFDLSSTSTPFAAGLRPPSASMFGPPVANTSAAGLRPPSASMFGPLGLGPPAASPFAAGLRLPAANTFGPFAAGLRPPAAKPPATKPPATTTSGIPSLTSSGRGVLSALAASLGPTATTSTSTAGPLGTLNPTASLPIMFGLPSFPTPASSTGPTLQATKASPFVFSHAASLPPFNIGLSAATLPSSTPAWLSSSITAKTTGPPATTSTTGPPAEPKAPPATTGPPAEPKVPPATTGTLFGGPFDAKLYSSPTVKQPQGYFALEHESQMSSTSSFKDGESEANASAKGLVLDPSLAAWVASDGTPSEGSEESEKEEDEEGEGGGGGGRSSDGAGSVGGGGESNGSVIDKTEHTLLEATVTGADTQMPCHDNTGLGSRGSGDATSTTTTTVQDGEDTLLDDRWDGSDDNGGSGGQPSAAKQFETTKATDKELGATWGLGEPAVEAPRLHGREAAQSSAAAVPVSNREQRSPNPSDSGSFPLNRRVDAAGKLDGGCETQLDGGNSNDNTDSPQPSVTASIMSEANGESKNLSNSTSHTHPTPPAPPFVSSEDAPLAPKDGDTAPSSSSSVVASLSSLPPTATPSLAHEEVVDSSASSSKPLEPSSMPPEATPPASVGSGAKPSDEPSPSSSFKQLGSLPGPEEESKEKERDSTKEEEAPAAIGSDATGTGGGVLSAALGGGVGGGGGVVEEGEEPENSCMEDEGEMEEEQNSVGPGLGCLSLGAPISRTTSSNPFGAPNQMQAQTGIQATPRSGSSILKPASVISSPNSQLSGTLFGGGLGGALASGGGTLGTGSALQPSPNTGIHFGGKPAFGGQSTVFGGGPGLGQGLGQGMGQGLGQGMGQGLGQGLGQGMGQLGGAQPALTPPAPPIPSSSNLYGAAAMQGRLFGGGSSSELSFGAMANQPPSSGLFGDHQQQQQQQSGQAQQGPSKNFTSWRR